MIVTKGYGNTPMLITQGYGTALRVREVLRLASTIADSEIINLESSFQTLLNIESHIKTAMSLNSIIELEEA